MFSPVFSTASASESHEAVNSPHWSASFSHRLKHSIRHLPTSPLWLASISFRVGGNKPKYIPRGNHWLLGKYPCFKTSKISFKLPKPKKR